MPRKFLFFTRFLVLIPLFWFSGSLLAQQKYTIKGFVKDSSSGEDVIGASVIIQELSTGAITNEYGFFSITLPQGTYTVEFRYLSYKTKTEKVVLDQDITMNAKLAGLEVQMDDVVIEGERPDENVKSTEMSTVKLNVEQVKKLPALFGEVDIMKTIQLMPGIQPVGEGITGFYVRGGNNDHNLILLDEATVFNASHILGFFSVFNSDVLKDEMKLYKGGIPAQYGGRLASVLELRMREGNNRKFHFQGGLGAISSRLTIEAPIFKDKCSFVVAGRRTYADAFLVFSKKKELKESQAYFYDLNAKLNYTISDKDRLFLSGYFGRDVFGFQNLFGNNWGNATGTLRWNHLFSKKLFSNTTLIFSDFYYGLNINFFGTGFTFNSGVRDFSLKSDYSYFLSPRVKLRFGYNGILHRFNPGQFQSDGKSSSYTSLELQKKYAFENAFYLANEHKINENLSLEYGLRYSFFDRIGSDTVYTYSNNFEKVLDTLAYGPGQLVKHFGGFEPRVAATIMLGSKQSLKLSYNRMRQYLHLASNSTASFPWDIWIPSGTYVKPQIADQVAAGIFRNFNQNKIEASVEVYYKWMQNQIDFKNGAELLLNPTLETELLIGKGWAYGAEFFVKKNYGKLTGWVGYTLAWVRRQIPGINNGEVYSAKNDRRHDVSIVLMYDITKRFDFAATWVYFTGNATTFPRHKTELNGFSVPVYSGRNQDRMPDFHRLDLAANIKLNKNLKSRLQSSLNISLYNAYGRRNAFSIEFREDADNPGQVKVVKTYLFRWVPSVTWNFNF